MSKKVINTVILIMAVTFVASMFPFSGVTEAAEGKTKILFIPFTMEHVFQKELCDGAKIPIEGYDLEVIVEDPYGKIERELEILETYMTQDIDGVAHDLDRLGLIRLDGNHYFPSSYGPGHGGASPEYLLRVLSHEPLVRGKKRLTLAAVQNQGINRLSLRG